MNLNDLPSIPDDLSRTVDALYEEYVTTISTPEMAVSLETARVLIRLGLNREPLRVLDFGSGFSTVCFGLLKQRAAVSVVTVDADPAWLEKSRQFLDAHDLQANVWSPGDDAYYIHGTYDLILHDIGDLGRRAALAPVLWELLDPDGIIVFDDMHFPSYAGRIYDFLRPRKHTRLPASRELTLDRFDRWALVTTK